MMYAALQCKLQVMYDSLLTRGNTSDATNLVLQCATLYNSEMAPAKLRGALNILFQLMVTIGILIAQLVNYGTQHHSWGWRVSLAIAFIPAFILFWGAPPALAVEA